MEMLDFLPAHSVFFPRKLEKKESKIWLAKKMREWKCAEIATFHSAATCKQYQNRLEERTISPFFLPKGQLKLSNAITLTNASRHCAKKLSEICCAKSPAIRERVELYHGSQLLEGGAYSQSAHDNGPLKKIHMRPMERQHDQDFLVRNRRRIN
jgi:hypothetical protein